MKAKQNYINKVKIFIIILIVPFLFQSCLTDIRPKEFRSASNYNPESRDKALRVLEKYAFNSGASKWKNIYSYQIYLADDFFGLKGKFAHPYPDKSSKFKLKYIPNQFTGTLEFMSGEKKGEIWGYDEGVIYTQQDFQDEKKISNKKAIKFWIPTYQYFIELPFRISNADVIYHAGEDKYGLYVYDKIFISWRSPEPQRKLDQYMLWVNRSSGLVDKMQFTIRDQSGILKGTAILEDYQNYNGIQLPAMYKIYMKESSTKPLHIMRTSGFIPNRIVPETLKM